MCRQEIFENIEQERDYQDARWGTEFDDLNTANDWASYINRYASNACEEGVGCDEFERQMTKVAALAIAAIECSQRNGGPAPRHYDAGRTCTHDAVDEVFTGLRFKDLPEMPGLELRNLEDEAVREYKVFGGGIYRIENPIGIYTRPGGTTHRVVDRNGYCHCVPFPNEGRTILCWKPRNTNVPVQW